MCVFVLFCVCVCACMILMKEEEENEPVNFGGWGLVEKVIIGCLSLFSEEVCVCIYVCVNNHHAIVEEFTEYRELQYLYDRLHNDRAAHPPQKRRIWVEICVQHIEVRVLVEGWRCHG